MLRGGNRGLPTNLSRNNIVSSTGEDVLNHPRLQSFFWSDEPFPPRSPCFFFLALSNLISYSTSCSRLNLYISTGLEILKDIVARHIFRSAFKTNWLHDTTLRLEGLCDTFEDRSDEASRDQREPSRYPKHVPELISTFDAFYEWFSLVKIKINQPCLISINLSVFHGFMEKRNDVFKYVTSQQITPRLSKQSDSSFALNSSDYLTVKAHRFLLI